MSEAIPLSHGGGLTLSSVRAGSKPNAASEPSSAANAKETASNDEIAYAFEVGSRVAYEYMAGSVPQRITGKIVARQATANGKRDYQVLPDGFDKQTVTAGEGQLTLLTNAGEGGKNLKRK